jgi:hypothetical protein
MLGRAALLPCVVLAACYSPQLERCVVRCSVGDPCPLDMTCGADNRCHSAGDTAACPVDQFTLKVTPAGAGSGIVMGMPQINCPPTCSEKVNDGASIDLVATANAGSRFAAWGGPCSGVDTCSVQVTADVTVGANFVLTEPLTVDFTGNGFGEVYSDPQGLDCTSNCSVLFDQNTVVTLMALPDQVSAFTGWSGPCAGQGTCVVTLGGATQVTAQFD